MAKAVKKPKKPVKPPMKGGGAQMVPPMASKGRKMK